MRNLGKIYYKCRVHLACPSRHHIYDNTTITFCYTTNFNIIKSWLEYTATAYLQFKQINMDYLKKRMSHFSEQLRPVALERAAIGRVPVEILIQIMECLPTPSAAVFSVCCMYINRLVGDRYLNNLASYPADRIEYLCLLARNRPYQIICSPCRMLHKMKNGSRYTRKFYKSPPKPPTPMCVLEDANASVEKLISINFSSTVFQMAMKHYQQNPHCSRLLKLLSYSKDSRKKSGRCLKQARANCRIIQGSMFHRMQIIFIPLTSSASPWVMISPTVIICRHLSLKTDSSSVYITPTTVSNLPLYGTDPKAWSSDQNLIWQEGGNMGSELMRCRHCRTEFRLEFKPHERYGLAMFFTRWKDLGHGPDGEAWKENFRNEDPVHPNIVLLKGQNLPSKFGDADLIRCPAGFSAIAGDPNLKFSLSSRPLSYGLSIY